MGDFVHDKSWSAYCDEMSRDGIWGDHLTLVAIAEVFGARIRIVSSVEGDNYITEIDPTVLKTQKMILISHYVSCYLSIEGADLTENLFVGRVPLWLVESGKSVRSKMKRYLLHE